MPQPRHTEGQEDDPGSRDLPSEARSIQGLVHPWDSASTSPAATSLARDPAFSSSHSLCKPLLVIPRPAALPLLFFVFLKAS